MGLIMYSARRLSLAVWFSNLVGTLAKCANRSTAFAVKGMHGRLRWQEAITIASVCAVVPALARSTEPGPRFPTLTLVDRRVAQDQGAWVIDYRIRHNGTTGIVILPDEIALKVEGWVSNSRVPTHAVPRRSSLIIPHGPDLAVVTEVIAAADEMQRCRERLAVSMWTEDQNRSSQPDRYQNTKGSSTPLVSVATVADQTLVLPLSLPPHSIVHVRLRLEHQHILYGDYDPLLSTRAVELTLGSATVHDLVPLDREQYRALPTFTWPEPPEERRDTRHAISGPDSLHIEAHVPGHQAYRYPERPVRYSTKMRFQFWYLIAAGTEGECRVSLAQCKETPTSWGKLSGGTFDQTLKTIGRWTRVERIIQTEAEATTVTLEFKIIGETEIGEMWIDDVSLEPLGCSTSPGP
jgi:hypothetical protein